ncbi:MAG: enoyl-CoA hydratase-related protein, partial [Alphaproteobacteria bacterium]|nr:enoyl-CoA hydratase-related protein [Alphaproteobacteria bacterium]
GSGGDEMTGSKQIGYARSGAVATVTIDRPEKRNALALRTVEELGSAIARADGDAEVRVVVLTGAGEGAFASGADLDELPRALESPAAAADYDARVGALYDALQGSRLPIVARIQGHAIGGGCLLALACDLRVAREAVAIAFPVSRIGLMLSPREHRLLVDQVGPSRAKLLLFTGRRLTAREAAEWNLVDVVAAEDAFDVVVDGLVEEIAAGAPLALKASKRLVDAARSGYEAAETAAACYREVYGSEDLREGLAAVAERRTPVFRGR